MKVKLVLLSLLSLLQVQITFAQDCAEVIINTNLESAMIFINN